MMSRRNDIQPADPDGTRPDPINYFQNLLDSNAQTAQPTAKTFKNKISPLVVQAPKQKNSAAKTKSILKSSHHPYSSSTDSLTQLLFNSQKKPKKRDDYTYLSSPKNNERSTRTAQAQNFNNIYNSNPDLENRFYTTYRTNNSEDLYKTEVEDHQKLYSQAYYRKNLLDSAAPSVRRGIGVDTDNINSARIQQNDTFIEHREPYYDSDELEKSSTEDDYKQNYHSFRNAANSVMKKYPSSTNSIKHGEYDANNTHSTRKYENASYSVAQNRAMKNGKLGGPGAFPKTALRYSQKRHRDNFYFDDDRKLYPGEQSPTSVLRKRVQKDARDRASYHSTNFSDSEASNDRQRKWEQDSQLRKNNGLSNLSYFIRSSFAYMFGKLAFFVLLIFYAAVDLFSILFSYTIGLVLPKRWLKSKSAQRHGQNPGGRSVATIVTALVISITLLLFLSNALGYINTYKQEPKNEISKGGGSSIWYSIKSIYSTFGKGYKITEKDRPKNVTSLYEELAKEHSKNVIDKSNNGKSTVSEAYLRLEKSVLDLARYSIRSDSEFDKIMDIIKKIESTIENQGRKLNALQHEIFDSSKKNRDTLRLETKKVLEPMIKKYISKVENSIPQLLDSHKLTHNDYSDLSLQIKQLRDNMREWIISEVAKLDNSEHIMDEKQGDSRSNDKSYTSRSTHRQVDYALFSAGARVIRKRTSPSWAPTPRTISGKILQKLGILQYPTNPPSVALDPYANLGECWPMQGSSGTLSVKLARLIKPKEFAIEHVLKTLAIDTSSAPKDIEVWGYLPLAKEGAKPMTLQSIAKKEYSQKAKVEIQTQGENGNESNFESGVGVDEDEDLNMDKGTESNSFSEENPEEDSVFTLIHSNPADEPGQLRQPIKPQKSGPQSRLKSGEYIKLASFQYEPSDSSPVQYFGVDPSVADKLGPGAKIRRVDLKIISNWGNKDHTCIYRFSVFGE